jgi:hypothetical protein
LAEKVTQEELKELLGDIRETVTVKGKTLEVTPMDISQIADALDCVERLPGIIGAGNFKQMVAKLILRGGHDFIELLRIATREELDWVRSLNPVDSIKLAKTVYQVNHDFFVQNTAEIKELLGPLWDLAENWISEAGLGLSSVLSETDTTSKKSSRTRSHKSATSTGQ